MTDEELIARAKNGDKGAESELLIKYTGMVRAKARGFFLIGGEAEDLIQEGMIGLYSAIGTFRPDGGMSFKNYACVCISRKIIDAVKSSVRQKNLPLNNYVSLSGSDFDLIYDSDAEEAVIRTEDAREFFRKMSGILSDVEFRVVVLYMEGMTYDEISSATGKTNKSIDNALHRAKRKLREIYKQNIGK